MPLGGWSRDPQLRRVGRFQLLNIYDGGRGIMWQLLKGLGHTTEEIEDFVTHFRAKLLDQNIRTYGKL